VLADAIVVDGIDAKTADAVKRFVRLIEQFRAEQQKAGIAQLIARVIDDISYHDALAKLYPEASERESRLAALEEIVNAAGSYDANRRGAKAATLAGFLDDVLLGEREDSDEKESQLARNAVALMTLHSAKGLEFPHVYLVGMEEGILPHKRSVEADGAAIDEERRLCYVGVTRAREQLTLSFALTRRKWGKPRKTTPSRFLYEMTGQVEKIESSQSRRAERSGQKKRGKRKSSTTLGGRSKAKTGPRK
jgi:DNA helicase-2/ATP-dependent DNA helicase PcrA